MTWFIFSLLSVFSLATAELTQQHLLNLKNSINERASAVLTFLLQSFFALVVVLVSPLREQFFDVFTAGIFYRLILTAFILSIAMIFYLKSFKVKNISISAIFISNSVIIATILGVLFFEESLSLIKFVGIFCILVAVFILKIKNTSLEENHRYALFAAVLFGVIFTLDKSIVLYIQPLVYIFWVFLFVSFFGFLFSPREVINSVKGKKLKIFIPVLVSAIGYFLFNLFTFFAYRFGGEVGKVDAINNSQVFLIILFEFIILGQKQSLVKKLFTALIAGIGVVLLGMN